MPIVTRQILTPEEGLRLSLTGKAELTVLSANDPVFNAPLCQLSFSAGARTFWQCASGGRIFSTWQKSICCLLSEAKVWGLLYCGIFRPWEIKRNCPS